MSTKNISLDTGEIVFRLASNVSLLPNDGSVGAAVKAFITDSTGQQAQAGVAVVFTASDNAYLNSSAVGESVNAITNSSGFAEVMVFPNKDNTDALSVKAVTSFDESGQSIDINSASGLEAPKVFNASEEDDWTLDEYDVKFGVQTMIPKYLDAQAKDIVTFYWGEIGRAHV